LISEIPCYTTIFQQRTHINSKKLIIVCVSLDIKDLKYMAHLDLAFTTIEETWDEKESALSTKMPRSFTTGGAGKQIPLIPY